MEELTKRQEQIYEGILSWMYEVKIPPTINNLRVLFAFNSNNSVDCHLRALKNKGYIEMSKGMARAIRITDQTICPYCRRDVK